jgi:hypothetical protein
MATILIENIPESVVKTFGTKIRYTKGIVFPKKKRAEDVTLLEYIKSDEYKNEKNKYYADPVEFLADLRK